MIWILLAVAVVLPPAIILFRPRRVAMMREWKVRVAGSIASVWLAGMLMVLSGDKLDSPETEERPGKPWEVSKPIKPSEKETAKDANKKPEVATDDTESDVDKDQNLLARAGVESTYILMFGWIPGAVYTGLLVLMKKGLETQPQQVFDPRARRRGPPAGW